jgi:UDP-N-acetylglucosamine--N-acetylmuramyl-(pentapeptide) pyrophosphoryl-undecaprenol N-acetylglucosamine transferase
VKIAIACGGTGGHIFPGLAAARTLERRGHDVALWLSGKTIESEAMNEWSGKVVTVPSRGFQGHSILRHVNTAFTLIRVTRACRRLMISERPDAVLAMGSYASIGPGMAAARLAIPLVLHEANVIPGRAVRMLARRARKIGINFEETSYYLKRKRGVELSGMPLRPEIRAAAEEPQQDRKREGFTILIMGGSGGAHALNQLWLESLQLERNSSDWIRIIHLSGLADESEVKSKYATLGIDAEVHGFHHDISQLYRRSDLAICRAGASTCAELKAFALPALLVPYPHAANDHQRFNAQAMVDRGVADLIDQGDITPEWLADYLRESIYHPERLERMRSAAMRMRSIDGAERLADMVESI